MGDYADDYFPIVYRDRRDIAGAKIFVARLSLFMPTDTFSTTLVPTNPVEAGLADLWERTTKSLSTDVRCLFRRTIEDFAKSWLWEFDNHVQNRIPDPVDYIEMRRRTYGWEQLKMFFQVGLNEKNISSVIYETRTMREISGTVADYICLTNDIFSYQKEMEFEGELNNGVLVAQYFLKCSQEKAVAIINDLMTARMQQFEHLVATELPLIFAHFNLNKKESYNLSSYIERLQYIMSGNLQWHCVVDRYKEPELQNERLRRSIATPTGFKTSTTSVAHLLKTVKPNTTWIAPQKMTAISPTGLGTSAAHIAELLNKESLR